MVVLGVGLHGLQRMEVRAFRVKIPEPQASASVLSSRRDQASGGELEGMNDTPLVLVTCSQRQIDCSLP